MIQSAIRRLNFLEETTPMAEFVKTTFPDEWEIASRILAPGSEGSL